ncbi:MAG TPA: PAS domain S-box protein [Candidatus Limnocylindrales bacterium]
MALRVAGGGTVRSAQTRAEDAQLQRDASVAARLGREANLSALFRHIDEGFCLAEIVVDERGAAVDYRFLEVNPQFEAMTGLRDAAGRTALELVPDLESHWVEAYARVGLGREVLRFEQGSDAMGRRFDVFATPVEPHGRFALVFKDVTERHTAEVALRDSEARWRGIFDNAAVGVAQVDLEGRWVRVNGKLAAITGYAPEELVGRTFADITHPDDVEEDRAQRARLLAGEIDTYTLEKRYLRKDGRETWVNLTVSLARGVDGQPDVLITVVQDISARRDADARLHTALAIKDEFLGHVSHELRTPLTVIYGMSRMLARPELDPAQARAIGADIADSAEHLNALVESMLLLARLDKDEAGQLREPVLLHRAAAEVLARFRERDPGRVYGLVTRTHETLVDAQPGWLARVIENLVGNAAKYAGSGTPVTVEIEPDPLGVRLTVLDEGPGLSDDDLERVFEPFFRTDDARQRAGGSGLGLAVSRRIVELLGGTIRAARRPTGGAAFSFTLPLADEDAAGA